MPVNCTIHRSVAAHFQCDRCSSSFCDDCVTLRESPGYGYGETNKDYFCPACEMPVKMIGLGNVMEPFWTRLTSIFLYPLQPTPLILTFILSLLGAFFPGSFFIRLAVWVIMMKYAYAALTTTAQGALTAPKVTWELINQDVLQVFKQFVVFGIIGFVGSFIFGISIIAGVLFAVIIVACIPSIIMVLVSSNSILQAVNPLLFVPIIKRIGWPYLLMYLFLFFLLAAPAALFSVLPLENMNLVLVEFTSLFFSQLYTLVSYHLMGYVLLQYHEEIGYTVDYDFFIKHRGDKKQRKPRKPEDELKTGLAVLMKSGKYQEAVQRVRPYILEDNPNLELSEKFHQLLKMTGEHEKAANYAAKHFEVLVKHNKKKKAADFFSEVKESQAGPPAAECVAKVASWFEELSEFKKALAAYAYFTKQYKKHPLIPDVYFRLAKLLHEQANNSDKAKQILKGIVKTWPQHELAPKATKYLALLP